jgi:hypothetical protein
MLRILSISSLSLFAAYLDWNQLTTIEEDLHYPGRTIFFCTGCCAQRGGGKSAASDKNTKVNDAGLLHVPSLAIRRLDDPGGR